MNTTNSQFCKTSRTRERGGRATVVSNLLAPEPFRANDTGDTVDFSAALRAMQSGNRLARSGWAPHEFVVWQKGYPEGIGLNKNTAEATGLPLGTVCVFDPYLMKQVAERRFAPWTPGTTDVTATDWFVQEDGDGDSNR